MGRLKRHTVILTLSLAIAGVVSFVRLQGSDRDFTIRTDVRLVLLDVSVRGHDGALVTGLTKDDFKIYDNNRPVDISVFASQDIPVTVGILVDESLSMRPKRAQVLTAAFTFIEASNPKDEVFVLNFNSTVQRGLPPGVLFSDNILELRTALYTGKPEGQTALNDAVVTGLGQLKLGMRDKKTLILISDGGDNISQTGRSQMLDLVAKSAATIYTIGIFDAGDPDRDPGILKQLAKMTGGEAYFPDTPEAMVPVCQNIAEAIRTRYTLGFKPADAVGQVQRRLRVEAFAPGQGKLNVRTRNGYWTDDGAESAKGAPGK